MALIYLPKQRALRIEEVTIIANNHRRIHTFYEQTTMPSEQFERFKNELNTFTTTNITFEILANFLRDRTGFKNVSK